MNTSRAIALALSLALMACQAPVLESSQPSASGPTELAQDLVPESKGGTLGKGLVPESTGGTLGKDLVPESKGGTLGKGLVPESKGGTLGRVRLAGQVSLPAGFRTLQNQGFTVVLKPPGASEPWVTLETTPDGRFEIEQVPVDTLLTLSVAAYQSAGQPLQALFRIPLGAQNSSQTQNINLQSTAEALLLQPHALDNPKRLPLPHELRKHPNLQSQLSRLQTLLSSNASAVQLSTTLEQAQTELTKLFAASENPVPKPDSVGTPTPEPTSAPTSAQFTSPPQGQSYSYGSPLPIQIRLPEQWPRPLKVEVWANGGPLRHSDGTPLAQETSGSLLDFLWQNTLGAARDTRLELRVSGANFNERVTGPLIHFFTASGGSQAAPPFALSGVQGVVNPSYAGEVGHWSAENTTTDDTGVFNGLVQNQVHFGAGKAGRAFGLNGDNSGILWSQIDFASTDYTCELWVKVQGRTEQVLLSTQPGLRLGLNDAGQLTFSHDTNVPLVSQTALDSESWHHVVAVKSGNREQLFLDGQEVATRERALSPLNAAVDVHLGYGSTPNDAPFKGLIDNLTLYRRALSPGQIQARYAQRVYRVTASGLPADPSQIQASLDGQSADVLDATGTHIDVAVVDPNAKTLTLSSQGFQQSQALPQAPLQILGVSRTLVADGDQIILNGSGFDAQTTVTLNGTPVSITKVLPNAIQMTLPGPLTPGNLRIQRAGTQVLGPFVQGVPFAPLSWWRFEGSVLDRQNNHNGTPVGSLGYVPGKFGQGVSLSNGAHINLGTINAFQGEFSFTGWFSASPQNSTLISATTGGQFGASLRLQNTSLQFEHVFPYAAGVGTQTEGSLSPPQTWHHFALIKTNLIQRLFIDGVLVHELDNATQFDAPLDVLLGRILTGDSTSDFNGTFDETLLFQQALTPDQVQDIFQFSR